MNKRIGTFLLLFTLSAWAEPNYELTYQLKASVVKVHVATKSGGHGVGTGVVVANDVVATNCHVLANATGVNVAKYGDTFAPTAMQADWKHDVCLLRIPYLGLKPVEMADTEKLQYEQDIFSIGFPGGPPKPQVIYGKVKALYPFEDGTIVRTDAAFVMGASGSPVFDAQGKLVALSTFKSPGRKAYYYNVPVKWIKALMQQPETTSMQTEQAPFWDAPEEKRPYFMRVILPYQNEEWQALESIAQAWVKDEASNAEAEYYLAYAQYNLGKKPEAMQHFDHALRLHPGHTATLEAQSRIAQRLDTGLAAKSMQECGASDQLC